MRLPPPVDIAVLLASVTKPGQVPVRSPMDDWRKNCDLAALNRWERTRWLPHAMAERDEEAVNYLLERGFAKYAKTGPACLLWHAIGLIRPDYVRRLVALGCDPNCRDKAGEPILHQAIGDCYPDVVQALLDGGADPNLVHDGFHPLDWADETFIRPLLLAAGAKPEPALGHWRARI